MNSPEFNRSCVEGSQFEVSLQTACYHWFVHRLGTAFLQQAIGRELNEKWPKHLTTVDDLTFRRSIINTSKTCWMRIVTPRVLFDIYEVNNQIGRAHV